MKNAIPKKKIKQKKRKAKGKIGLRFLYEEYLILVFPPCLFYAAVEGAERAVYVFHKRKSVVVLF